MVLDFTGLLMERKEYEKKKKIIIKGRSIEKSRSSIFFFTGFNLLVSFKKTITFFLLSVKSYELKVKRLSDNHTSKKIFYSSNQCLTPNFFNLNPHNFSDILKQAFFNNKYFAKKQTACPAFSVGNVRNKIRGF
jgi:hypothetical protein